ncbi:antimicrobial peptide system SdpB family protein [Flavobacterium sp. 9]|uniref:sporulation-delaying protein SdpB family protein n=1 Tax=Flavobacterium sp. 9 TaxID=2035198 RepID=UPI000C1A5FE3|nr:sporulation-delaying protein SdpB family protein [Flavobacterium sp. 9]PIF34229.1 antimicrobial peptide system SdpB family protein [Flavobacterium sp. 9]
MNNFFLNIYHKSQGINYHTNTLGLVRSLLAFSTLIILLVNPASLIFHTGLGVPQIPYCSDSFLSRINLFCVFSEHLVFGRILAIVILLATISGFFPKITAPLHWWVTFSVNAGLVIVDGGCQVAAVLTFMIIPLVFTDNRTNHWSISKKHTNEYANITAYLALQALKLQVAFIYLDSAMSKLSAPWWTQGTALYYFINDPIIGATGIRLELFNMIFNFPVLLVFFTYFVILLEFALGLSPLYANKKKKSILFKLGILFHILIFLTFGIFTFVVTMFAALIILFLPMENNIRLNFRKNDERK